MGTPLQSRPMVEMNGLVAAQFRRIYGRDSSLELPCWWATQIRHVVALQDPCPLRAIFRWGSLTRAEQQCRLLDYLQALPKAPLPRWSSTL